MRPSLNQGRKERGAWLYARIARKKGAGSMVFGDEKEGHNSIPAEGGKKGTLRFRGGPWVFP